METLEPSGAPSGELATVVSLDDRRRAAATPSPEAMARARAAHPAQQWVEARAEVRRLG